jgi:hypothetical protein
MISIGGGGVVRFVPLVMVVERGDDTSAWYWKGLPTRTLAFERQKCAPRLKSSKECLMVMCCGNASGNHKLKMVVIGKAKTPQSFKGTKANCIPVHYYNQKGAWKDREIFENWFHKHFVPEVQAFMKERGLPQKGVLLLDNAPLHPRESIPTSNDGLIVKFLPPNATAVIQPMDQGVIISVK